MVLYFVDIADNLEKAQVIYLTNTTIQLVYILVTYFSDEEFEQLKVLMGRWESRKRQQRSYSQRITNEEEGEVTDNDEKLPSFDEIDNAIVAFVESRRKEGEEEAGPNQSQIVQEIQKNHSTMAGTSRVTLLKRIEYLVKYKVIIERLDSKNRQTKRYYVNKESLLLKTQVDFDRFEKALVNIAKTLLDKDRDIKIGLDEELRFLRSIFMIYQHVSNLVVTRATVDWPRITNDTFLLNKLYRALFARLIRLQQNLSRVFKEADIDIYQTFFHNSWVMRPDMIHYGITFAKNYELSKEDVFQMYNLAWSIGAPVLRSVITLFGDGAEQNVDKWSGENGWKDAYEYWVHQRRLQQKKILFDSAKKIIKEGDEVTR
jgi:hypothetical protein